MNKHVATPLALLMTASLLTTISGCAAPSTPTQAVIGAKVKLTPLPADVTRITPSDSASYLARLSTFREKVRALSGDATTK